MGGKTGWIIRLKRYWLMVFTLPRQWLQAEFLREPILGHVLLNIFINDLEEDTESSWVKLADDIKMSCHACVQGCHSKGPR